MADDFTSGMPGGGLLGQLQSGQYYTDPQGQTQQALMASERPVMSMPDAIANYLSYTGGQWPAGGIPGVPQPLIGAGPGGFTRGESGLYTANPTESETAPLPEGAVDAPGPNETGLFPGEPLGEPTGPNETGLFPGEPPQTEALAPEVPGQLIGGMSPEKWLKKYRGETT